MQNSSNKASRRGFFLTAGAATAAVATVAVIKTPATPTAVVEVLKPAPAKGGGYQLTEHVKQYYKTALV